MEPPSNPPPPSDDSASTVGAGDAETAGPPSLVPRVERNPISGEERRFHHYEVCLREDGATLHELGRGAMGVSYKARDVNLDTFVAIKVIRSGVPALAHARERFRREARSAAQLRHQNVASVFHFGETPGGECFYAMEFVEGETLSDRVKRDGPLPPLLAVEIALQVAAALIAADERGLVHRDLKPANIMLVARSTLRSGSASTAGRGITVKVIDFGLAKAASAAGNLEPLTQTGGFLGTPAYASPEQADGEEVDARSDIYSLGVTLWFLLTGKVPFSGKSLSEIIDRQLHRPLPVIQLSEINAPEPLVELLTRMLASNPGKRPPSPGALYEELDGCREQLGGKRRTSAPSSKPGRRWTLAAIISGVLLLGILAAGAYRWTQPRVTVSPPDKSIAVLPLEDRSEGDKSNGFFADGIQDDLLNSLAKIHDLKVISRSSVMGYRDAAARNLPEIARQLGVTTILEGSVRRAPDRVLVSVALVEAATGRQLWSERYDRTLENALTLQGELATEIAVALKATLSPEEKVRVETKPTDNPEAYVLYLRARDYQTRPTHLLQDNQTAQSLYAQALKLDPRFALAHARLAESLAYVFLNYQPTAEIKARARAEADEAARLRPEAGEGILARAICLYWTERDYPAALRELDAAARLMPGNAEIDLYSGAIRRRQGRWREALAGMRSALVRDPRSVQIAREIMVTDCLLRDWPTAARDGQRAITLAPELPMLRVERNWIEVWARGDFQPLRTDLAAVPAGFDPDGVITIARWDAALAARDFAGAERLLAGGTPETTVGVFGPVTPKSYLAGCLALARGDAAQAHTLFETARPAMEADTSQYPLDAFRQAQLGLLYAYLGRNEEAVRCGRRATELLPEEKDANYGSCISGWLALIYARAGETDQAIALLQRLLSRPGALFAAVEGSVTQSELRLRWQWDPLRSDPRFQKILSDPEPKVTYR